MVFQKKANILSEATKMHLEQQRRIGTEPILPEPEEVEESAFYEEARHKLEAPQATVNAEQERYVREMADEIGFFVIPKMNHKKQLRELTGLRLEVQRLKSLTPSVALKIPKVLRIMPPISKPKRKKQRLHVERNGKKSRRWKGRHAFSFPDSVWKVRK